MNQNYQTAFKKFNSQSFTDNQQSLLLKTQSLKIQFKEVGNIKRYSSTSLNSIQTKISRSRNSQKSLFLKQNLFKSAKNIGLDQKNKSYSYKNLISKNTEKYNQKFQIPLKNDKKDGGKVANQKLVEQIMSRLNQKNSIKIGVKKIIQSKEFQTNFFNLDDKYEPQLKQEKDQKIKILQQTTKVPNKILKQDEQKKKVIDFLQEKSKHLQRIETEIERKMNQMEEIMEEFKHKQKVLFLKQELILKKEKQMEEKISKVVAQKVKSSISQIKKQSSTTLKQSPIPNTENQLLKNQTVEPVINIKPPNTAKDSFKQSYSVQKIPSDISLKSQSYFKGQQIKMESIKQADLVDVVKEQKAKRKQQSFFDDIEQIQTPSSKFQDIPIKKSSFQSQKSIKSKVAFEEISNEFSKKTTPIMSNNVNGNKKTSQIPLPLNKPKVQNTPQKFQQIQKFQEEINFDDHSKRNSKQSQNRTNNLSKDKEQKNKTEIKKIPKQEDKGVSNKPELDQKSNKKIPKQGDKGVTNKPELDQKSNKKKQFLESLKKINRQISLIYFIGEIPLHCSNHMRKNKKYSFKIPTLYLFKYVYDKFRYFENILKKLQKQNYVTQQYYKQRVEQNKTIKENFIKMKAYAYKKEPFPLKQSEKYLDQQSANLCFQDKIFLNDFLFREIRNTIEFYRKETGGKWLDHQVNLCYYRMMLSVFILQEIQMNFIVIQSQEGEDPDYMLSQIEKFTENQLREKMSQSYQILIDLEF